MAISIYMAYWDTGLCYRLITIPDQNTVHIGKGGGGVGIKFIKWFSIPVIKWRSLSLADLYQFRFYGDIILLLKIITCNLYGNKNSMDINNSSIYIPTYKALEFIN